MGNFDGVHLGHQSVLALAHAAAAELGAPFGVVTFEPHPRSFFAPGRAGLPADDRRRPGAAAGEARGRGALRAAFGAGARRAQPRRPSSIEVLAGALGVRHVVVGADFRFGKGRAGDAGRADGARGGAPASG